MVDISDLQKKHNFLRVRPNRRRPLQRVTIESIQVQVEDGKTQSIRAFGGVRISRMALISRPFYSIKHTLYHRVVSRGRATKVTASMDSRREQSHERLMAGLDGPIDARTWDR